MRGTGLNNLSTVNILGGLTPNESILKVQNTLRQ